MSSTPWLRAGWLQAKTELRINFLTPSFLATVIGPIISVVVVWFVLGSTNYDATDILGAAFALAGMLGVSGAMAAFGVMSEMYTERTEGTLLRLRMVPDGIRSWVFGKTLSVGLYMLFTAGVMAAGTFIAFPSLIPASVLQVAALVAVLLASYFVFLPLGIMAGTLTRTTAGLTIAMLVFFALYAASGTVFPITYYPEALQWVVGATPFYWSAHIARWALLPAEAGTAELLGTFQPLLGLGVMTAWAIVAYALAPRVLRRGIRRETVGALMAARDRLAAQGYA
ncbi:ABC transporter permease [Tessaracoccus caeni]|uniref:ABC transporter permease n=1 Tax=Tessaracoccus caeni TaxID=3031239 RepID=UPI0023DA3468|nr:ABC transporter permease [Tessaracoccus caeni]MDF1487199.1 ABC transporter permease [Tessaracoccus caeni]